MRQSDLASADTPQPRGQAAPRATTGGRPVALIGAALGWGSGRRIGANGALRLREGGLAARLQAAGVAAEWHAFVSEEPSSIDAGPEAPEVALRRVGRLCPALMRAVRSAHSAGKLPVTLGGDNAVSIGHYLGLMSVAHPLGVIWIDAHPDANTWKTSPSKAAHGMVVATITGHDHALEALPQPVPGTIPPSAISMIGIRAVDPGERQFIDTHGIHVETAADAAHLGLADVLAAALNRAMAGTAGFGLSLDLDAIDPARAPGVAFPEPDGLDADALCAAVSGFGRHPGCRGIDITEFAPEFDRDGRTEALVERLLLALLATR